jgi:hypothetical protein
MLAGFDEFCRGRDRVTIFSPWEMNMRVEDTRRYRIVSFTDNGGHDG